jgi:hypothetical protein
MSSVCFNTSTKCWCSVKISGHYEESPSAGYPPSSEYEFWPFDVWNHDAQRWRALTARSRTLRRAAGNLALPATARACSNKPLVEIAYFAGGETLSSPDFDAECKFASLAKFLAFPLRRLLLLLVASGKGCGSGPAVCFKGILYPHAIAACESPVKSDQHKSVYWQYATYTCGKYWGVLFVARIGPCQEIGKHDKDGIVSA